MKAKQRVGVRQPSLRAKRHLRSGATAVQISHCHYPTGMIHLFTEVRLGKLFTLTNTRGIPSRHTSCRVYTGTRTSVMLTVLLLFLRRRSGRPRQRTCQANIPTQVRVMQSTDHRRSRSSEKVHLRRIRKPQKAAKSWLKALWMCFVKLEQQQHWYLLPSWKRGRTMTTFQMEG